MQLSSSVVSIPGVGEASAAKLEKLGISTVFDFLYHLPFRYEDRSQSSPIGQAQPGETVTLIGEIVSLKNVFTHSGRMMQVGELADDSGKIRILWFNQTFLTRALKTGTKVALFGKVDFYQNHPAMIAPEYELIRPNLLHLGRLVPIYPETAGISSKWYRNKINDLLTKLPENEILPQNFGFMPWAQALKTIHFPDSLEGVGAARDRLAFDELFLLQLQSLLHRQTWHNNKLAHPLVVDQEKVLSFIASLPFVLTASQNQAISAILSDLSQPFPANRLLQGDVGSGKTVVAAVAALVTHLNGFQTVVLAPTQILATQHYQTFTALFKPLGINVSLVTGNRITTQPSNHVLVGTHALLSDKHHDLYTNIGLVVIDEQHRFGVAQRALASTLGVSPHILTMTATPIPRTVALTMFGDLDLSFLEDKPLGRLPVKTWVVPESKRQSSYDWISQQLTTNNQQLFWICPFINDSETLSSVKAATTEFDNLKKAFPKCKLGLLHGKMKAAQKDEIIRAFRAGEFDILVTTPVVEVGVDIPNATIMVIEGAERFGLSQLHQLRGRVGRSSAQSYCLLFSTDNSKSNRLKAMEQYTDGRKLAELDLKLRGPGEIFGTSQHGFPQFRVAKIDDERLVTAAAQAAKTVLPDLPQFPLLRDLVKEAKISLIQPN